MAEEHSEHPSHSHIDPELLAHGAHSEHGGVAKYVAVFCALLILTAMSFFTYSSYWPFPKHVAWVFMIAISCTKAMLVIMFFMHLLFEANWKWVLTVPASVMSIFLMLMLVPDIGMRQNNGYAFYSFDRWRYTSNKPVVDKSLIEAADKEMPQLEEAVH
jgi:cytochrome c oxidase subunit 4